MTELAGDGSPRSHPELPVRGSVEGLLVEVSDALDADLDTLDADDWALPVDGGFTVQTALAHLIAVHELALDAVLDPGGPVHDVHLDAATDRRVATAGGETVEQTRACWRESVARLRSLARCDQRRVPWLGVEVTPAQVVLDRAFETWIHANDIRRAINRASLDPSGEHLKLLCDFAIELLPQCLRASGRRHDALITVNLSGPGGGAWVVPLGRGPEAGEESTLAAAARELCLLMGDRIDPLDFACTVRGSDAAVAATRALVECAPHFARR